MDAPIERHELVFLNPDLAGLFAAHLSHRAGVKVAIIDELKRWQSKVPDFPQAFPAEGTFRPQEVDSYATASGFPPPTWQRLPLVEITLPEGKIALNSDGGVGGLMLAIAEPFRLGRSVLMGWLQNEITKTREHLSVGKLQPFASLKRVETSVADSILGLHVPEPDPFIILLDTLTILVLGRGAVQLDVRDFHHVLAHLLTGWHGPAPGDRTWAEILLRRLRKEGAHYHEVDSIAAVQSFGKRSSVVRGSDGTLHGAQLLVVPECDRFLLPLASDVSTVRWQNWHGRFAARPDGPARLGILRPDPKRSPVNDNFVTWRMAEAPDDRFTVSAPVESRYLRGDKHETITSRIRFLLNHRYEWQIAELKGCLAPSLGPAINLPGTAPCMSYPEGPLWGDDVLSRIRAADRLSRRILESIK